MNPKIWRVAVIPRMPGVWSCSPEFVVLRPNPSEDPWRIALALHHPTVMQAVQAMAQGTSSSRQRVPKECVLAVNRPEIEGTKQLADYVAWREEFYAKRLSEGRAYEDIHQGGSKFAR